jgi:hypothetical protein
VVACGQGQTVLEALWTHPDALSPTSRGFLRSKEELIAANKLLSAASEFEPLGHDMHQRKLDRAARSKRSEAPLPLDADWSLEASGG